MLTAFALSTTVMEKQFLVQHISVTEKQMTNYTFRKAMASQNQRRAKEAEKVPNFPVRARKIAVLRVLKILSPICVPDISCSPLSNLSVLLQHKKAATNSINKA